MLHHKKSLYVWINTEDKTLIYNDILFDIIADRKINTYYAVCRIVYEVMLILLIVWCVPSCGNFSNKL